MSRSAILSSTSAEVASLPLNKIIFFLFCIAFPNGLYLRAWEYVTDYGFVPALYATFNISAVIFVAMFVLLQIVRTTDFGETRPLDPLAIAVALGFAVLPISPLTWVGQTGLGLYFLATRPGNPSIRNTFLLLLALCFSSLWSRLIFHFFMEFILEIDAFLVATLMNRPWSSNLVVAADGLTTLQILEGCSSFANMSLAFLGWIIARSWYGTRGFARSILFIAISCAAVVLINTTRIGLIALHPEYYQLIHGSVGAGVASLLTSLSIAGISIWGARR
ncbi:hypothetical protein EYW49_21185 [Siculibacillus lacustris]|uniref:Exosortase/archaeosortase family protein n=1 Tax=Siculibacillus lacustris TaxID=1549641 RepID=A0A4Q9VE13_9HYPH|nr:hypothetical protein [Siculibacillus lacustris]TBW32968.1 hypothetical protein EYW49_21185 [Siculibacillus lacustris]